MKVNVAGNGVIPGLNRIPPVYGVDMEEAQVSRLLNFSKIRVYAASTGGLITRKNIVELFKQDAATKIDETVSVVANEITTPVYTATEPVVEEITESVSEVTEESVVEEAVQETVTEPVVEEDVVEEPTVVEDEEKPHYNNSKKSRKNNKNSK